jgi:hypothetical protein
LFLWAGDAGYYQIKIGENPRKPNAEEAGGQMSDELTKTEEEKEKCRKLLATVYNNYFNVYQFLNQFKNQMRTQKCLLFNDYQIPSSIVLDTCRAFLKNPSIKTPYPYFRSILKVNIEKWWVAEQDKQHAEAKRDATTVRGGIEMVFSILERMKLGRPNER